MVGNQEICRDAQRSVEFLSSMILLTSQDSPPARDSTEIQQHSVESGKNLRTVVQQVRVHHRVKVYFIVIFDFS